MPYFNYRLHAAETNWERQAFLNAWWRIFQRDPFGTPPYYPTLKRALNPNKNPHIARLQPHYIFVEALPRRPHMAQRNPQQMLANNTYWEIPIATAVWLQDPRRRDATAYFSLYQSANDKETMAHLLGHLMEKMRVNGIYRLIGPVGLSPHLGSGLLQNSWHIHAPRHLPNSPPYLPELVNKFLRPTHATHLYQMPVPTRAPTVTGPATLHPLDPAQLTTTLHPLLVAACEAAPHFPPPDAAEATFLYNWLHPNTFGWVAYLEDVPVGFVWLQADANQRLRAAKGGRSPWRRAFWKITERLPTPNGTLLFGAVLPSYRRQGIGRQLLQQSLHTAHTQKWQTLQIGPLLEKSTAVSLLHNHHGQPQQTYQLYEQTL